MLSGSRHFVPKLLLLRLQVYLPLQRRLLLIQQTLEFLACDSLQRTVHLLGGCLEMVTGTGEDLEIEHLKDRCLHVGAMHGSVAHRA